MMLDNGSQSHSQRQRLHWRLVWIGSYNAPFLNNEEPLMTQTGFLRLGEIDGSGSDQLVSGNWFTDGFLAQGENVCQMSLNLYPVRMKWISENSEKLKMSVWVEGTLDDHFRSNFSESISRSKLFHKSRPRSIFKFFLSLDLNNFFKSRSRYKVFSQSRSRLNFFLSLDLGPISRARNESPKWNSSLLDI